MLQKTQCVRVMESNFIDEIDCANFFDQIEDLIDFPPENEAGGGNFVDPGLCKDFPSMWNDAAPETGTLFTASHAAAAPDLCPDLFVPYEDIEQLEWLPSFADDSFSSGGMSNGKNATAIKEPSQKCHSHISSPVSVLESSSSSSSSVGKTLAASQGSRHAQRARSKRPRPLTFTPKSAIQLVSPSSSSADTPKPRFYADNFTDSPPIKRISTPDQPEPNKKKRMKPAPPLVPSVAHEDHPLQSVRKCLHCEITKTPQWRTGPMGPKTLCNACGVRHKSGRLFPEYRPAASPTFVPSLHSNSHKKVVEMRSQAAPKCTATATSSHCEPELGPSGLMS